MESVKQRITALLCALIIAAAILLPLSFIALHSDHYCTGGNCKICLLTEQCIRLINAMTGTADMPSFSAFICMTSAAVMILAKQMFCETLISLKVELLD